MSDPVAVALTNLSIELAVLRRRIEKLEQKAEGSVLDPGRGK